jgi:5-methylcytosine-specific restriction protein A
MTNCVNDLIMSSDDQPWEYIETVDPALVRREREKAREMRGSSWWKQQVGKGVCYHCEKKFSKENLTMDHLIPLSRGGRSSKKNIVVACKGCNSHKKNLTVAEIRLSELKK